MEIRQLRYLVAIAEAENFTRAAESLYVSQPALTQQIHKLEHELSSTLFDRSGRVVRLTSEGQILYDYAKQILNTVGDAQIALDEVKGLERGDLQIGVVQTMNAILMPSVVLAFKSAYPDVRLSLFEEASDTIEARLRDGDLQIGVGFVPTVLPEIAYETLFDERLVMIVSCEHPLAERQQIEFSELELHDFVMLGHAYCTRRLVNRLAEQEGISLSIDVEMNTIYGILQTIQALPLATILPEVALTHPIWQAGLVGIPIVNPTPSRSVGLLYRRTAYQCSATRAFKSIFKTVYQEQFAEFSPLPIAE